MKVYVAKTWKKNHRYSRYKYHKSCKCALSCINIGRKERGIELIPESEWKRKLDFFHIEYYQSKGLVACGKCCKEKQKEAKP